jgi:hypothetical protein
MRKIGTRVAAGTDGRAEAEDAPETAVGAALVVSDDPVDRGMAFEERGCSRGSDHIDRAVLGREGVKEWRGEDNVAEEGGLDHDDGRLRVRDA